MAATKSTREEIERKKSLAFTLYVDNGFEQKVISEITGISETSISKWKNAGKWDDERRVALMGPEKQMRRILKIYDRMLVEIEKRKPPFNIPDSKEADIISKLADAAKKLRSDNTLFVKAEIGKQFISFLQEVYGQEKAIEIIELWHEYLMK